MLKCADECTTVHVWIHHRTKLEPSPAHRELQAAAWHSPTMAAQDNANKMPGIISLSLCATACRAFAFSTHRSLYSNTRHRLRCGFMWARRSLSKQPLTRSSHFQSAFVSQPQIRHVNAESSGGLFIYLFSLESPAITSGWFEAKCSTNIPRVLFESNIHLA